LDVIYIIVEGNATLDILIGCTAHVYKYKGSPQPHLYKETRGGAGRRLS
jgi:hypothetical protein